MSAPQDDGGPAFPQTDMLMNLGFPDIKVREVTGGLSIRDWFAGMALQGVLSNSDAFVRMNDQQVAACAYSAADAMLAARKEEA